MGWCECQFGSSRICFVRVDETERARQRDTDSAERGKRPPPLLHFSVAHSTPDAQEPGLEEHRKRLVRRVSVAGESFDAESAKQTKRVVHYKTAEAAARIRRHVQNLLIFRGLDAAQVNGALCTCAAYPFVY